MLYPPWLNVHSMIMEPVSQCFSPGSPTPPWFPLIQIKSINWGTSFLPWCFNDTNHGSAMNNQRMITTKYNSWDNQLVTLQKEEGDYLQRLGDHFQPNRGTNCNVHEFSWLTICKTYVNVQSLAQWILWGKCQNFDNGQNIYQYFSNFILDRFGNLTNVPTCNS